jgi:hypothetical protein
MHSIRNALNATKPNYIDNIELSQFISATNLENLKWKNPKIYLSGKNLNQAKVLKFISLLLKMVSEYNSSNIDKNRSHDSGFHTRKEHNEAYLRKMAEVCWLDFELSESTDGKKKVSKV